MAFKLRAGAFHASKPYDNPAYIFSPLASISPFLSC